MNARATAARAVAAVAAEGRTLEAALAAVARERQPAVQSLAFGTVRWFHELEVLLSLLMDRPPETLEPRLRALALVGLYQLAHGETPAYAAVTETVEAARALKRPRAAGLLNALLRRFLREREALLAAAHEQAEARHAHPQWLVDALAADWPQDWQQILEAGNRQPPMWLRVNRLRQDRDAYLAKLQAAGIEAAPSDFAPEALRLSQPCDVGALPGFAEGEVSVQDAAAQLAAHWLGAGPGMRVLDACAAPGGKTGHLLELCPGIGELLALDVDPARAQRIGQNLERLGLRATVAVGDATEPAAWWDGRPFDRILLDVPCSGTGVIRRHPDIKLLRRPADIEGFARRQRQLLDAAFGLLAPGGRLLYASCSVLSAENAAVVGGFLGAEPRAVAQEGSASLALPGAAPLREAGPGFALPSGAGDADGFYYACLEKRA